MYLYDVFAICMMYLLLNFYKLLIKMNTFSQA